MYLAGWQAAVLAAIRVFEGAAELHQAAARRLEAERRAARAVEREQHARLRLLLTRTCAWGAAREGHFCGAPAAWLRVDADGRPIEFRCAGHRTDDCHALPDVDGAARSADSAWSLDFETGDLRATKTRPEGA